MSDIKKLSLFGGNDSTTKPRVPTDASSLPKKGVSPELSSSLHPSQRSRESLSDASLQYERISQDMRAYALSNPSFMSCNPGDLRVVQGIQYSIKRNKNNGYVLLYAVRLDNNEWEGDNDYLQLFTSWLAQMPITISTYCKFNVSVDDEVLRALCFFEDVVVLLPIDITDFCEDDICRLADFISQRNISDEHPEKLDNGVHEMSILYHGLYTLSGIPISDAPDYSRIIRHIYHNIITNVANGDFYLMNETERKRLMLTAFTGGHITFAPNTSKLPLNIAQDARDLEDLTVVLDDFFKMLDDLQFSSCNGMSCVLDMTSVISVVGGLSYYLSGKADDVNLYILQLVNALAICQYADVAVISTLSALYTVWLTILDTWDQLTFNMSPVHLHQLKPASICDVYEDMYCVCHDTCSVEYDLLPMHLVFTRFQQAAPYMCVDFKGPQSTSILNQYLPNVFDCSERYIDERMRWLVSTLANICYQAYVSSCPESDTSPKPSSLLEPKP